MVTRSLARCGGGEGKPGKTERAEPRFRMSTGQQALLVCLQPLVVTGAGYQFRSLPS